MRRKSVRKFPGEKKNDDVAVKLINASEFETEMENVGKKNKKPLVKKLKKTVQVQPNEAEMENVGKKNKKLPVKKLKKTVQVQPNEDDELDDDEEASDKNYEPEQHDMRMVISGGQLKKNKAIIKKMDAPVSNENESVAARIMKVRCRPHSLELLIKDLTPKQIDAVKEVGFGGILGLKLTETCKIMMPWLVERFNGASLMFNIGVNKEFVVTRYDVYDVFCLPMNVGNDVPEIAIVRVGENIDSQLKDVWKQQFNVHGYDGIPLGKIEARIRELIDGGDEFKKLFVMHALCSFLTPTANRTVDLKLAKALHVVSEIRNYDWCSYVLGQLGKHVSHFKDHEKQESLCGCMLLLEIIYFHRLKFQGKKENTTIPLIQHWTDERVRKRVKLEKMANDFGQGLLDESTYPVSERYEHVHGVLPQPILLEEEGDKRIHHQVKATSSTGGRFIEVQLLEGAMTDGEIVSSARNAIHEAYLFLKRDMEVISHVYTKRFQTFQELATDLCFGDASLSSDSPEISQTQEFFSDPEVLNMIDGIVEKFTKMRSATELFRAFGGPSGGAKRVVDDVGHDNEEGSYATRSCKAFCFLDCGELGGSITYVSCFMKSNARLMTSMSRLALEVVDYSMVDDSSMDSGESLVTFGLVHIIPREDMLSLDSCKQIYSSIVECYSLFLNELNRLEGGGVRKFFFGVRHSLCLLKLFDYRDSDNSSYANDLQNCWEEWVTSFNSGCDIFVANLCDQMGDFLAKRNHPNAELVPHYKFEVQEFDWKSSKSNNDCGVFLIHHMQFYEGTKFDNVHLMKALGRRFLRAQICATLVLSDMNESRNDTLSKLDDFNKNRDVLAAEVRSRKKAIVVAQKERMNQEKEKAQKMVGLEKGSGTKVKRIIKKRRLS